MQVQVVYWVHYYDKVLGWKQNEVITITPEQFFEISKSYDVAIMNCRNSDNPPLLAIDEKGKHFRTR